MKRFYSRLRARLSFANVTSALALFVALGGTSYAAVSLPHDSVGSWQIRSHAVNKPEINRGAVGRWEILPGGVDRSEIRKDAVGPSEVRKDAISSDEVQDGTLQTADLAAAAKSELIETNAVTFRAASNGAATTTAGNAKAITRTGAGMYTVDLGADVSKCQSVVGASGAGVTAGFATAEPGAAANLLTVKTYDASAPTTAADEPFTLLVSC